MRTNRRTRRSMRSLALASAGALTLGLLPSTAASANHGTPFDLLAACEHAPDHTFDDADSERLETVKDCLQNWQDDTGTPILQGSQGEAHFDATISRAQFSAVLLRMADILGVEIPEAPAEPTYPDVPTSNPFYGNIESATSLGLFLGTSQTDEEDLDDDGDTEENLFDPSGAVSYGQAVSTIKRLMTDAVGQELPDDEAGNESGLECGVFQGDLETLEGRSFFDPEVNTLPDDCRDAALRGPIFDLVAVTMTYEVAVDQVETPHTPPAPDALEGVVVDVGAGTYDFVVDETGERVTVITDADDSFTVDGQAVSQGIFDSHSTVGDQVTWIDDPANEDDDQHDLTNVDEITGGFINDITATTFDIVEPHTGVVLRANVTFGEAEDSYTINGTAASQSSFQAELQPGDRVNLSNTDESDDEPEGFNVINATRSGDAANVNDDAVAVTFDIDGFNYTVTAAGAQTGSEELTVDGEEATFSEFADEISDDDAVSVSRTAGVLTVALTNRAPDATTGTVTENHNANGEGENVAGVNQVRLVVGDERVTVTYTSDAEFRVDDVVSLESDFEAALSAGDTVTYQPADDATETEERIALTSGDLDGLFVQAVAFTDNDAMDTETIDLANEHGGVVFLGYDFPVAEDEPARWLVNGHEVTAATFEGHLEDIAQDEAAAGGDYVADDTLEITVSEGISTSFDLTTDNVDADA